MMRALKITLIGLLLVLVVLSATAGWLLHSSSGAAWLWSQVEKSAAGSVHASRAEGDLGSGFTLHGFRYLSDSVDINVGQLEVTASPGWWPLSVQIPTLTLIEVDVVTRTSESHLDNTEAGVDIQSILAAMDLPVAIEIHKAVISSVSHRHDDAEPSVLLESLSFQAALGEALQVENLELRSAEFEAVLQARLALEPPYALGASVNGRARLRTEADPDGRILPFDLEAAGDLDRLEISLNGLDDLLHVSGEIDDPVGEPGWRIQATLDEFRWPIRHPEDLLELSALTLHSQGQLADWDVQLESAVDYEWLPASVLALRGTGSATGMLIESAQLKGPGIDVSTKGRLNWSTTPEASLIALISQLDLSPWLDEWPAGQHLAGELNISWSEAGLRIPASKLVVPGTTSSLTVEADIDLAGNTVEAELDWLDLSWPLVAEQAEYASPEGSIRVTGNLESWQAAGRIQVRMGDYPQGFLNIDAEGGQSSARVTVLGGQVLGGSIEGQADAGWADSLNWNLNIHTAGIDPSPVFPDWPGRLDIDARVEAIGQSRSIQVQLDSLQGMLRGIPVSADGKLRVEGDSVYFSGIEVRTDEAELWLDGNADGPDGIALKFSGYLPSMLLDGASGSLELDGRYSSHGSHPLFEVNMQALDLAWSDLAIKSLALTSREADSTGPVPAFKLDATQLSWQENSFNGLTLSLNPAGEEHVLSASLSNDQMALNSVMTLAPERSDDVFSGPWAGRLDELVLSINQAYDFKLVDSAPLQWSAETSRLGPACLEEDDGAQLCLNGQFNNAEDWSLRLDASTIPLNYLRDIFVLDLQFEQLVDGYLEWNQAPGKAPTGGAEFRISAGRILDADDNELLVESREGRLSFSLQNGNLEAGALDIEFPGNGFIDLDFEVNNLLEFGARNLAGRALVQLQDIDLVGQIVFPEVDRLSGSFESNIVLGGTLSDPSFNGGFKLSNGAVQYSPFGFRLDDIEISGQLERRDRGSLEGRFRAGEGTGTLKGNLVFKDLDDMQMLLALKGEQLLLFNTDPLKIHADTDLKIELAPQRMDINGVIRVPAARLTPANLLLETVSDSEDLVIESDAAKVERFKTGVEEDDAPPKTRIYGELEVAFGDDIIVKVPGVETHLSGSVLYRWGGDPVPMAEGNYTLKGKVDVYGPTLRIDNGQISFPNVPADNPLLNIRAGREIFGNTQIRSAGVQVTGNLKRPVLKAYTVPITNEDRAWTLLVTGTDFDQAQGVGGFDVGTYILPKLYVSYGISLFEDENVISARYDLKKGFGFKVTSGQRETGLDASYTIDR